MANYLYNGVLLPTVAGYPHIFITDNPIPYLPMITAYFIPEVEYGLSDSGNRTIAFSKGYKLSHLKDGAWEEPAEGTGTGVAISNIDWATFDIFNEDGTLYLAASDPVPVSTYTPNPAAMALGMLVGQAVRKMRGTKQPEQPPVQTIVATIFDGEITVTDTMGMTMLNSPMPVGTEFIAEVNGTSFGGIIGEGDQYFSDNMNAEDGSADYTEYPIAVFIFPGSFGIMSETDGVYPATLSVMKYPDTMRCYNGIWLYAFDWDKEQYPYVTLMAYDTVLGPSYRMYYGKFTLDRTQELYLVDEWDGKFVLHTAAEGWGSDNASTAGNKSTSEYTAIWANYDILNEDGTIHLATSDPVPVYE